jgi:hypothetical protein
MMQFLAQLIAWMNIPMNAVCNFVLIPIAHLPGWVSNAIYGALAAPVGLLVFKYASDQDAIGRVSDSVKANMLALKLFKDSFAVTMQAQGRLFKAAFLVLYHALRPSLVMLVPFLLLFCQLGLWYQARPLLPGERGQVIMELNGDVDSPMPDVTIASMPSAEVTIAKTTVPSTRRLYWEIEAKEASSENIVFQVGGEKVEKELVIGSSFMPVSPLRPGWNVLDILENPREKPFPPDSVVKSISIKYPDRISKTSGTNWWMGYFLLVSMVFGLILMPFINVKMF